jgi:hypothetical protein
VLGCPKGEAVNTTEIGPRPAHCYTATRDSNGVIKWDARSVCGLKATFEDITPDEDSDKPKCELCLALVGAV